MSFLDGVIEHYTVVRGMRIHHPDVVAQTGRFTGKTRTRVLMLPATVGGTRRNAGTILNTPQVRRHFAAREARMDSKIDSEIARMEQE